MTVDCIIVYKRTAKDVMLLIMMDMVFLLLCSVGLGLGCVMDPDTKHYIVVVRLLCFCCAARIKRPKAT